MYDKVCPMCGTRFVTELSMQKYCDEECAAKAYIQAQKKYRDKKKPKKNVTLDDKVRAAEKEGISYGQYVIRERLKNASNS